MKRIPLIVLCIIAASLVVAANAFAQGGDSTADDTNASISIQQTLPVTASVDVNVNGQVYKLAIPVTVNIDAQKALSDSVLSAPAVNRVGDLAWNITDISEYADEFNISQFQKLQPSSADSKLVVVTSELTNLDSDPFKVYPGIYQEVAFDDQGNTYDKTNQDCTDINPGSTETCVYVFDVPKSTHIVGVDVQVLDHKRIPYAAQP